MLKYMKLGYKGHFWIGNDSHIRPLKKWPNKITAGILVTKHTVRETIR